MSKKMTPCEKLGYKVGDKFTVIKDSYFEKGTIVVLSEDDGSEVPWFTCGSVRRALIIGSNPDVEPAPSKLKPAKQALADAIYQNGGWDKGLGWNFSTCNRFGVISFWDEKPVMSNHHSLRDWCGESRLNLAIINSLPNWHQCILSRGEYFIAYPEQVKVEIGNDTKHNVDVEMKSEPEMTIKVGDWHKNGELPPVGVFVGVVCDDLMYGQGERNREVIAHVENTAVIRMGYSLGCFASHALAPAKSERDWAIDEIVSEFIDHYGDPKGGERYIGIAAKLYEAGYRKEVN